MGETVIHRQTMANAMRFTTTELGDLARAISEAGDKALGVELVAPFDGLTAEVLARAGVIALAAAAMARLDVATALATLASEQSFARPRIDDSLSFVIEGGRHQVVAAALASAGEAGFVANDLICPESKGGSANRSQYGGQGNLPAAERAHRDLAQMGGYVPAEAATIGVVDRLFSRVGAADDLSRGRSTFMVEMVKRRRL